MKKIMLLIFVLLVAGELKAQQASTPADTLILDKFFHKINRGTKSIKANLLLQYHNTPHSINTIDKRFCLSIDVGTNHSNDFCKNHIPFDTGQIPHRTNYVSSSIAFGNVSYTYVPGFGFQAGLVCAMRITGNFSFEGGLMYYLTTSKQIKSKDTAERNMVNDFNERNFWETDNLKESNHSNHSIVIPFYFCFNYKRLSALVGTRLLLLSIYHNRTSFLDNSDQTSNSYNHPFQEGSEVLEYSVPSAGLRYVVNRNKIPISVYLTANRLDRKDWDFLAGLQLGIFSK